MFLILIVVVLNLIIELYQQLLLKNYSTCIYKNFSKNGEQKILTVIFSEKQLGDK